MDTAKPILREFPSELTSERLLLRPPRIGDGAIIFPSVQASLAELKQWMPWAKDSYSQDDAEEWCRRSAANFITREQLQLMMLDRVTGQHVGNVGMFKFNWDVPSCEIGYWLHTARTGQGLMTEVVNRLTVFGFDELKMVRIQILTDERNARSYRVAERCGYELEGTIRCDCRTVDGRLRNTRVYSRIRGS